VTITHNSTAAAIEWGAPASFHGTRYRTGSPLVSTIYIAERDGTQVATVVGQKGKLKERLNLHSVVSDVQIPRASSALITAATPLAREFQVWIGDELRCAGPIVSRRISASDGAMSFGSVDAWWYFTKLLRGGYQPWSRNYFQNFRFDDGFARWLLTGTVALDATHTTDGGTDAAMIDDDADSAIGQLVRIDLDTTYSAVVDFKVWIESGITSGRGLVVDVPGAYPAHQEVPISADTTVTPRAQWTTLRAVVEIDGRVGARDLTATLHGAAGGKVWLGAAYATIFPISAITDEVEGAVQATQVDMATVLSDAIQATNSGLNVGVDAPATGQLVDYKPADDVDVYVSEIAKRLEDRDPGIDVGMTYGAEGTVRTVNAWYPRRGVDLDPELVTFTNTDGPDGRGTILGYTLDEDFTKATNEVTTIGEGDYRGTSLNEDAFDGVILQTVQSAPPNTPLGDLEGMSRKALRLSAGDVQALTVKGMAFLTPLVHVGDRALVSIADEEGAVSINAMYRVIDIDIDLADLTADYTLNLEPES